MTHARSQDEFIGARNDPAMGLVRRTGMVLFVLGLFAGADLANATAATLFYVGVLVTVAAALQIVHASQVRDRPGSSYWESPKLR